MDVPDGCSYYQSLYAYSYFSASVGCDGVTTGVLGWADIHFTWYGLAVQEGPLEELVAPVGLAFELALSKH